MWRSTRVSGLGLVMALAFASSLLAESGLDPGTRHESSPHLPKDLTAESMRGLAEKIILRFKSESVYRICPFRGPGHGGSELHSLLSEAMQDLGARVARDHYDYDVQGRFAAMMKEDGITGLRVRIEVFDQRGMPIDNFDASASWEDLNSAPRILSIPSVLPSDVSPVVRAEMLAEQWRNSPVRLVNHQVRTEAQGGFGVEMLVREQGKLIRRSLRAEGPSGTSQVTFRDREVYAIRLWNYTPQEVAAEVMIDGVNVFHHDDREPRPKHHLIPPAEAGRPGCTVITGYSFGAHEVQRFRIGGFAASVAADVGVDDWTQIGQIVVQFSPTSQVEEESVDLELDLGDLLSGDDLGSTTGRPDVLEVTESIGRPSNREPSGGDRSDIRTRGTPRAAGSTGDGGSSRSMSSGSTGSGDMGSVPDFATGLGPSQELRTRVQYRRIEAAVATVVIQYVVE